MPNRTMATLLDQLSEITVVVADTGDLEAIRKFTPRDATTNPSLILAAAQISAYQNLIDEALRSSRKLIGDEAPVEDVVHEALDEISACSTFPMYKLSSCSETMNIVEEDEAVKRVTKEQTLFARDSIGNGRQPLVPFLFLHWTRLSW